MKTTTTLAALFVLGTAACAGVEDPNSNETEQAAGSCPEWLCGANDPEVDVVGIGTTKFHELHEGGALNDQGMSLLGFKHGANFYQVDVKQGELTAGPLAGDMVEGGYLLIKFEGKQIKLHIVDHSLGNYTPAIATKTHQYRVTVEVVGSTDRQRPNVCSMAGSVSERDTLGQDPWSLVFFEGERYVASNKTITQIDDTKWFTLGCAGHVLAKLHLTHHSWPSNFTPTHRTTPSQRQTMLKMYSANYCGTDSFTVSGQNLGWIEDPMFPTYTPLGPLKLEARWNEHGAMCLEDPRMNHPTGSDPWLGTVDAAIDAHCGINRPRKCSDYGDVDVTSYKVDKEMAVIVTANP